MTAYDNVARHIIFIKVINIETKKVEFMNDDS